MRWAARMRGAGGEPHDLVLAGAEAIQLFGRGRLLAGDRAEGVHHEGVQHESGQSRAEHRIPARDGPHRCRHFRPRQALGDVAASACADHAHHIFGQV